MDHRRRKIGMTAWLGLVLAALFCSYTFGTGRPVDDAGRMVRAAERMLKETGLRQ